MKTLTQEIDEVLELLGSQVTSAAKRGDFKVTGKLSQTANELEELKGELTRIKSRVEAARAALAPSNSGGEISPKTKSGRKIFCEVTGGCIRQNLLTLTRPIQRGLIKIGEHLEVELPDGSRFLTDVAEKGNKLRERGEIAKFYRDNHVVEGDYVVLEETLPGSWLLRKMRPGEAPQIGLTNRYI